MGNLGNITTYDEDCEVVEKKDKTKLLRLDIACGNNKKEGFIGLDFAFDTQADWWCDLNKYPWHYMKIIDKLRKERKTDGMVIKIEDDSVYEIHCSHFIEHVDDLKRFMEEIYRVLIPGGRITFYAPYYSSIRAMQDYTHKRFISEATFLYFNQNWIRENRLEHYDVKCNFAISSCKFLFDPEWNRRSDDAKEWARKHNINVVTDIEVVLSAIKEKE